MSYFPVFVQLKNEKCIIVGGGRVAYTKAIGLLEAGGRVTIIAPDILECFNELKQQQGDRIQLLNREFKQNDLADASLVVAATNQRLVNQRVIQLCEAEGIMVNSASEQSTQGVQFSSVIRRGPITIAISSGGTSPLLAKYLGKSIEDAIPEYMEKVALNMEEYREYIIKEVENQQQRKEIFSNLLRISIQQEGCLSSEDVENVVINLRGGKAYDENQNRKQEK